MAWYPCGPRCRLDTELRGWVSVRPQGAAPIDVHARVHATTAANKSSSDTDAEATATESVAPRSADASASGCREHHSARSGAETGSRDVRQPAHQQRMAPVVGSSTANGGQFEGEAGHHHSPRRRRRDGRSRGARADFGSGRSARRTWQRILRGIIGLPALRTGGYSGRRADMRPQQAHSSPLFDSASEEEKSSTRTG